MYRFLEKMPFLGMLLFLTSVFWNSFGITVNAEETMSSYTSMRALDKFGNSVQLKHAREAATRYGRLVVAAASTSDDDSSQVLVVSVGNRPIVQSLTLPLTELQDDGTTGEDSPPFVSMCCTGVKSDAAWLTEQMQSFVAEVWQRYDYHPLTTPAVAHWMSKWLGSFQQGNWESEWQSSVGILATHRRKSKAEQRALSLSRPLGIQTIILSTTKHEGEDKLLLVEPTGRVLKAYSKDAWSFITIGKSSDLLEERLSRETVKEDGSLEQTLIQCILETLGPTRMETVEVIVETVRSTGIQRKIFAFRNGREVLL